MHADAALPVLSPSLCLPLFLGNDWTSSLFLDVGRFVSVGSQVQVQVLVFYRFGRSEVGNRKTTQTDKMTFRLNPQGHAAQFDP